MSAPCHLHAHSDFWPDSCRACQDAYNLERDIAHEDAEQRDLR